MDPEEIADLTRDGSVLLTHPDLPDAKPTAFRPETVPYWLGRGWEKYEPVVTRKGRTFAEVVDALLDQPVPGPHPAGNATTEEWRSYARSNGVPDADQFSRDELRNLFTVEE